MLLLNVGSMQGVAGFDPIVAPEGLIGVIWSASRNTSVAMTWAHPEFRVSAFTANGSAFGIVAASPSGTGSDAYLEFRGVPYRDSIVPGTVVLSSGLGGVYPKGIPIGTVVGVIREEAGWARVYRVRPAANPGSAAHVLVLTGRRVMSVAEGYPSDTLEPAARPDSTPAEGRKPAPVPKPVVPKTAVPKPAGEPGAPGGAARPRVDSVLKPKPKPKRPVADSTRPPTSCRFTSRSRRAEPGAGPPGFHSMNGPRTGRVHLAIVFVTLVLLHFYVRPRLFDTRLAPDFLLFGLVVFAMRSGPGAGALAGFLVGLTSDALSPARFGAATLADTVVGYAAAWGRAALLRRQRSGERGFRRGRTLAARLDSAGRERHAPGQLLVELGVYSPLQAIITAAAGALVLVAFRQWFAVRLDG